MNSSLFSACYRHAGDDNRSISEIPFQCHEAANDPAPGNILSARLG
jgi:hypothetical protein